MHANASEIARGENEWPGLLREGHFHFKGGDLLSGQNPPAMSAVIRRKLESACASGKGPGRDKLRQASLSCSFQASEARFSQPLSHFEPAEMAMISARCLTFVFLPTFASPKYKTLQSIEIVRLPVTQSAIGFLDIA